MITDRQAFYSNSALPSNSKKDILGGQAVKINPALITVTDGKIKSHSPGELQALVYQHAKELIGNRIFTVHVDVNYPDYHGYPLDGPDINTEVFSPAFVGKLNDLVRSQGGFLNLHLLTDHPLQRLQAYDQLKLGAVCFQLEVISDALQLVKLVDSIVGSGACASPVIETVGSENLTPYAVDEVEALLDPVISKVGMLTFQAAETAARSSQKAGAFGGSMLKAYLGRAMEMFNGTLQFQGGIKTNTIGDAAQLGAEFMVTGTEIFRNRDGLAPVQVIDQMLQAVSQALHAERD